MWLQGAKILITIKLQNNNLEMARVSVSNAYMPTCITTPHIWCVLGLNLAPPMMCLYVIVVTSPAI